MNLTFFIIKVCLLLCCDVTSAKLKLLHKAKSLDNHHRNHTGNPFNNTLDYNDLITLSETAATAKSVEEEQENEIENPLSSSFNVTTIQPFETWTRNNQMTLNDDKEDEENLNHHHYSRRHYTTLKFNKDKNNNLNSNSKLKTFAKDIAETTQAAVAAVGTTILPTIVATTIKTATTFNDNKNLEHNNEDEDDDHHQDDDVDNIEKNNDNLKRKHQTKFYTPNSFVGQLPQFQREQQLYQQQQQEQLQLQQPLLKQEYHHLTDYRFLFNPERHTTFYLHTISSSSSTEGEEMYGSTRAETFGEEEEYDNEDAAASHNATIMLTTNLTNPRYLNVVTDTIGAAFGVNTQPVAAIHGIRIEEIVLYNGLSLRQSRFNPFNPCRIIIHGWLGGSKAGIFNTLVPEYLKLQQGSYNVITVGWGKGALADYITASYRVKPIGRVVAKFIDFLHRESGVPFENIHLIGFSMGAHIAGIAGKFVQTGRLPVIYGLDPALPLFRYENVNERLDRSDADYVEVLHTSTGSYGYDHPLGHVDFYVNFGYNQPGCFFNECSHFRAFQIFAQTLHNEVLIGRECSVELWLDMIRYKRCLSETGLTLSMTAEGLTPTAMALRRGMYYVITNAQPPYKVT